VFRAAVRTVESYPIINLSIRSDVPNPAPKHQMVLCYVKG
jgi:hypothetical protein